MAYAASVYSAANLGGNIIFGALSDRFGHYRVAGVALIAMALTTWLHLSAWTVLALILIRMFHGFFAAAVAPSALAAASDGVEQGRRGQIMAQVGLMIAIASILAPPITGRLVVMFTERIGDVAALATTVRIQTAFLLVAGIIGIIARGARRASLQSNEDNRVSDLDPAAQSAVAPARVAAGHDDPQRSTFDFKVTMFACIFGFTVMFGQNILFYALPLGIEDLGMNPAVLGGLFGIFAVGAAIAFMPPFSRASDRFGRVKPIVVGSCAAAVGLFFLGRGVTTGAMAMMGISLFVYGFGFGLSFPAISAAVADGAEDSRRGTAYGLLTAAFSVGAIVSPILAQSLSQWVSPFTVGAAVMLVGLLSVPLTRSIPALHRVAVDVSSDV